MFRVSFLVSPEKFSAVFQVIQPEVQDLKVEQADTNNKKTKRHRVKGGSLLLDCALDFLKAAGKGREFATTPNGELGNALDKANQKRSNTSPLCSKLAREGYIRRTGPGRAVVL